MLINTTATIDFVATSDNMSLLRSMQGGHHAVSLMHASLEGGVAQLAQSDN